ncbi:MAG TPA: hypothetical protein VN207_07115 [Ktedonobacteraceae bacterium]|nr:hypothetical protein [Ktedonobacteraceae bacterium]
MNVGDRIEETFDERLGNARHEREPNGGKKPPTMATDGKGAYREAMLKT